MHNYAIVYAFRKCYNGDSIDKKDMKQCKKCKEIKYWFQFYKESPARLNGVKISGTYRRHQICKKCIKEICEKAIEKEL